MEGGYLPLLLRLNGFGPTNNSYKIMPKANIVAAWADWPGSGAKSCE